MDEAPTVHHIEANSRFEIQAADASALLEYRIEEDKIIMHHTFVPHELRGQGIAAQLVKAAINYAQEFELTVIPECSYIATYLERTRAES